MVDVIVGWYVAFCRSDFRGEMAREVYNGKSLCTQYD